MRRPDDRLIRVLLAAATCALVVALMVALTGGGAISLGPLLIRSHDPLRPALFGLGLALIAVGRNRPAIPAALAWQWDVIGRWALAGAVVLSLAAVAAGFRWGAFIAGGSDSYCYLNQAELLARGAVHDREPLSADPGWPGNAWSFAPAGHIPLGTTNPALVPICPAGYPMMMAAARLAIGRPAMFWVTPLMGGLAVWLAFLLGRRLAGPHAGLLTAALTLCSPTFLMQLVQPMNDVSAAALWCAALVVALGAGPRDLRRAAAAGLVSAAALTVRPNLLPLAAIVGLGLATVPASLSVPRRLAVLLLFGVALLPGVATVMAIQNAMYGSPLKSGYGDLDQMFKLAHVPLNLQRYPKWLIEVHTPVIAAALVAPIALAARGTARQAVWLLAFVAVTFACYLPYVVFDAWWYTRFLLPAIVPLLALTAAVAVALLDRAPAPARAIAYTLIAATLVTLFLQAAVPRDVFRMAQLERRFRSAGERVATLPPNAAIITLHHSGSVRFYAARPTFGWADIDKGRLDAAIEFLRRHGRKPYLMFEPWEEADFRTRFANDRLGALNWPPAVEVDGVRIYDPDDYERHRRGERVETVEVRTKK